MGNWGVERLSSTPEVTQDTVGEQIRLSKATFECLSHSTTPPPVRFGARRWCLNTLLIKRKPGKAFSYRTKTQVLILHRSSVCSSFSPGQLKKMFQAASSIHSTLHKITQTNTASPKSCPHTLFTSHSLYVALTQMRLNHVKQKKRWHIVKKGGRV